MFSLYEHQDRAVSELAAGFAAKMRAQLLVSPTGSGKTIIAAHMIAGALGKEHRTLFIAGRRQIVEQTYKKLTTVGGLGEDQVSVLMGADRRLKLGAPAVVSCVDTLETREMSPEPSFIVVDEAHQGMARYAPVLKRWPRARIVGLSATPVPGMGDVFQRLVQTTSMAELISLGLLARFRFHSTDDSARPDLQLLPLEGGDFAPKPTAAAVNKPKLVGSIVEHWRAMAGDRSTIAFGVDIKHAEAIAAAFLSAGISAGVLHSRHSAAQRAQVLERFESGELKVLSSCDCLSEGFDAPIAKCALLCRPTENLAKYLQQVGRVLRPYQDQTAVIIDPVGNYNRHDLPTAQHEFQLTGMRRKLERAPQLSTCPKCWAVFEPQPACPLCGHTKLPAPGKRLKVVAGQLIEVTDKTVRREPTREEYAESIRRSSFAAYPCNAAARAAFCKKRMRERFPDA